ncbi:MAG: glycosyl hydrolase [Chloroflexi bacterium]|nr:glycosyl hydrolase [Chloroflexota bacterium]
MNIEQLIQNMTLEEKATLVSGGDFWNTAAIRRLAIPTVMMTDGPHGLRKEVGTPGAGLSNSIPATCFPTASCLASSWDRDLVYDVGKAIAEEALEEGVSVVLGPGANIKRSPLCGRNFEYFSEDPYLCGEMARYWIEGMQSQGVGASLKHFAVNNQETRRMTIDAVVDERALREIYLRGFEIAVRKSKPWTVMAAYNRLNGEFCAEHSTLLDQILREEWGFEGLVVSDWGATNDRVAGLRAGLDLEMPGVPNGNTGLIIAAVQSGELDEKVLDQRARQVLELVVRSRDRIPEGFRYDLEAHHDLARRAAAEGAVLLKNENKLLPLSSDLKIAMIGEFAKDPRYQGSGSSSMNPSRLDTLYGEMEKLFEPNQLLYSPGYESRDLQPHQVLIEEAVQIARKAEVAVVCVGLPDITEVEGLDRQHLRLPEAHNALIEAIAEACPHVVVVLSNGAPVEMPWEPRVDAILEGYLGGQAGAGALADILLGKTSPSGKLAETFPLRLEDNPSHNHFPSGPRTVEYRESIYIGYRFYDKMDKDVLYPFGHGLSYTTFEYSGLTLKQNSIQPQEPLRLSFFIENKGDVEGMETAQVYIHDRVSSVFHPEKELAGFAKVSLKPGEKKKVELELDENALAFFSPARSEWVVEPGEFEILVGASSRDIRMRAVVIVHGKEPQQGQSVPKGLDQYNNLPTDGNFSAQGFEALLGQPLPDNSHERRGHYTVNTPIVDMCETPLGRVLSKYMQKEIRKLVAGFEDSPNALMMKQMTMEGPLRLLLMSAGSHINRGMMEGLLMMINGQLLRGLSHLLKARKALKR